MPAGGGDQRELVARLRVVIEAEDAENAVLRAELEAQRERYRRLELRAAELERRLGPDSTTSGTPPPKDPIGARERRTAERKARQSSERERRADRKPGGQPGHPGAGLSRDPDPDEREDVPPPAQCSRCGTALDGADRAGSRWSQVRDVRITTFVTGYVLPLLACPCCGKINAAQAPPLGAPGQLRKRKRSLLNPAGKRFHFSAYLNSMSSKSRRLPPSSAVRMVSAAYASQEARQLAMNVPMTIAGPYKEV